MPLNCCCISLVQDAEWTISPRTVSGLRAGSTAQISAASLAARAVASLVIESCPSGCPKRCLWRVVSVHKVGTLASVSIPETARLPPSMTISGLIGHFCSTDPLLVNGEIPPGLRATSRASAKSFACGSLTRSVHAPTVRTLAAGPAGGFSL